MVSHSPCQVKEEAKQPGANPDATCRKKGSEGRRGEGVEKRVASSERGHKGDVAGLFLPPQFAPSCRSAHAPGRNISGQSSGEEVSLGRGRRCARKEYMLCSALAFDLCGFQGLDLMKIREHVWCKIVVQMRCHARKISNSPSSRSSASRQAAAAISKPHARRAATAVDLANGSQRAPAVHADVGLSIHFFVMVNHGGARS